MFCAVCCADSAPGPSPVPDPDRDRVLEILAELRPEFEAALGDSLGPEVEVLKITEEECKEKVREVVLARSPEMAPDEFEEAWETLLLMQPILGVWGGNARVITDLKGCLCFVELPEEDEKLRRLLTNELIRIYQIRSFDVLAFLGTAGNAEEQLIRGTVMDAHKRFAVRRLRASRGERSIDSTAKARKYDPVSLSRRQLRVAVLEGAAFEARTDQYIAGRSEGLSPAEGWKRIFASPPKSIWEVVGIEPEVQSWFDLAVRARDAPPKSLKVSPLLPVLPGAVEGAVLTAGADRASVAGSLVQTGFTFSADPAEDDTNGEMRIRVISTADAESARKLEEIWLEAERTFDELGRAGSRFSALVGVSYEPVLIGAWRGTLIRRLEEDLSEVDCEVALMAWERQESVILTNGSSLCVVEVRRPSAFTVDPRGLARRILTDTDPTPWPEFTDCTEESLRFLLSHPDPQLRRWSLHRLEEEDWDYELSPEILRPLLEDADIPVRASAFRVLAGQLDPLGETSDALLGPAIANCSQEDAELRANAFLCLDRLTDAPQWEMQVLLDGLDDPVASVRYRALDAWTAVWSDEVPTPVSAMPTLIRIAEDPVQEIRWLAASAIKRLDSTLPGAAPLLLEVLESEHEELRTAAAEAFRHSRDDSPEVIEALRRIRKDDESESVREAAVRALRWLTGE